MKDAPNLMASKEEIAGWQSLDKALRAIALALRTASLGNDLAAWELLADFMNECDVVEDGDSEAFEMIKQRIFRQQLGLAVQ